MKGGGLHPSVIPSEARNPREAVDPDVHGARLGTVPNHAEGESMKGSSPHPSVIPSEARNPREAVDPSVRFAGILRAPPSE